MGNYWRYSKHIKARVTSAVNPSQLVQDKKKTPNTCNQNIEKW